MADLLVETCWRVRGRSGHEFRCELYRIGKHLELRVSYGDNSLVHTEPTTRIEVARQVAHEWLRRVIELEEFRRST